MPLPIDSATRSALLAREVAHAWLLELFTDEGTLRCWDKRGSLSFESNTFEGLGDQFRPAGPIKMGVDLIPEPLAFTFDGAPQNDDTSFIGRLLDRTWHQRKARLRGILLNASSNFTSPIGVHVDWNGWMDTISVKEGVGDIASVTLNCESGVFRALDRNLTTCTDADQRKRSGTDTFFQNVAVKPSQDVPFGTAWSNIPGGSRSGSGGGGGGSSLVGRVFK